MADIPWDPKKHLRAPNGQFRKMNLKPGWYEYSAGGQIKKYYINEMGQMESGSTILHMSAQGSVFNQLKHYDTMSRIHLLGNDEGEQFAIAASGQSTFGVINHDKGAPPETFSFNRGHDFQPVSDKLLEGETSFGGRAAQTSGRKDGKTYGVVNAQLAEKVNESAFNSPDAKVYTANPEDFAEAVVKARHECVKLGMSESQARKADVYVYADKKGNLKVISAWYRGSDGKLKKRKSPNTHGGSPSVMLPGDEVTRMTRAMQQEGLTDVQYSIAAGTSDPYGRSPRQNALHFRKEYYENPSSGDRQTMWGTIERTNYGTIWDDPNDHRPDAEKRKEIRKVNERSASRFYEPVDTTGAARLLRRKNGDPYGYNVEDIAMYKPTDKDDPRRFTWEDQDQSIKFECDGHGNKIGLADEDSFRNAISRADSKFPLDWVSSLKKRNAPLAGKDGKKLYGCFDMTLENPKTGSRQTRIYDALGHRLA
ncbi:hypothetical protein [Bifidobacterium sp. SO1]|uniref:hypothetical protein n=1 Tax=Bifidobacterium sp. SO1 TaxID=2809029 RepID=UPI001BDCE449|nr:hypothetical protein [Bifidobacterium sp. SO1]MBT1162754.1 hypothetical protein [Bifidobacterium sp. SO1]